MKIGNVILTIAIVVGGETASAWCSMNQDITSYGGYEGNNCTMWATKPAAEPYCKWTGCESWQIDAYNNEVEAYNSALEEYTACMRKYVREANADRDCALEIINEKVEEAVREYELNTM